MHYFPVKRRHRFHRDRYSRFLDLLSDLASEADQSRPASLLVPTHIDSQPGPPPRAALHHRSGQILHGGEGLSLRTDQQAQILTDQPGFDLVVVEVGHLGHPLESEHLGQTVEEDPGVLALLLGRGTGSVVLVVSRRSRGPVRIGPAAGSTATRCPTPPPGLRTAVTGGRGGFASSSLSVTPVDSGTGVIRTDTGPDARFLADPAEQPTPGFLDDVELGVTLIDAQPIEGSVFGFLDSSSRCLDPLHGHLLFRLRFRGRGAGLLAPPGPLPLALFSVPDGPASFVRS